MKVEVFKHGPTGRLFETEAKYEKFVKEYEEGKKIARARAQKEKNWLKIINAPRMLATSIDDFRIRVKDLWNECHKEFDVQMTRLDFERLQFRMDVPCSHTYPVGGKYDQKSVPGWTGQVTGSLTKWISISGSQVKRDKGGWGTNIPGLNTGTGGGGERFSFELRLYLEDFPLIYKEYKEALENREFVEKEIEKAAVAEMNYLGKKTEWVHKHQDVRSLQDQISDTQLQIAKLKEKEKLLVASRDSHVIEKDQLYLQQNPFDFTVLRELRRKHEYITATINPR
jgi:hypothetical protein